MKRINISQKRSRKNAIAIANVDSYFLGGKKIESVLEGKMDNKSSHINKNC